MKPLPIGHDIIGRLQQRRRSQLDATLRGQRAHEAERFFQSLRHANRLEGQLQIARFDPADVEHFVNEIEQVTAGANDVIDARALGLRWVLSFQELPKSENGVERRPQFVAHSGEKFALGVIGAVRLLLGLAEFLLNPGAVGHVVRHTEHDLVRLRPRS